MREVSWSATPETSDQRLGLHTSRCLATRRDSVCVCASSNPHRCLETRGVSLRCTSPVQPNRSSSRAPSLPTPRCPSAPASEMCSAELLLKSSSATSSLRVTTTQRVGFASPLSCLDRAVFKLCNRLLHCSHPVVCVGQLLLELLNHLLDIRV